MGASLALSISDIPFEGPIAAVRVGRIDGELVCNPSLDAQLDSDIDLIVAGSENGITMVEGGAEFVPEDDMVAALLFAEESIQGVLKKQKEITAEIGKAKIDVTPPVVDEELRKRVADVSTANLTEALTIAEKLPRYAKLKEVKRATREALDEEFPDRRGDIGELFNGLKASIMRTAIVDEGKRVDGRDLKTVRDITCDVSQLPRAHGSALFTRGETQAMVVATLGTRDDEQKIDALTGWEYKKFMLHYNFPPFCVGEARFLRGPGRREIGHGALAERAVLKVFPTDTEEFPYTVRIVSDILRVKRIVQYGEHMRSLALADGRRCADKGARCRNRHGTYKRGRQDRYSF